MLKEQLYALRSAPAPASTPPSTPTSIPPAFVEALRDRERTYKSVIAEMTTHLESAEDNCGYKRRPPKHKPPSDFEELLASFNVASSDSDAH